MELRFEKRHYIAGAIIMTAIFMNLFDFAFPSYLKHEGEYTEYVVLFTCGQVINQWLLKKIPCAAYQLISKSLRLRSLYPNLSLAF
jgi:hypothetical protein